MTVDEITQAKESIRLAREAQRLSHLKAIPGNGFGFSLSVSMAACFTAMCYQHVPMALLAILFFPLIIFFQKQKTGLWPFGFAPFMGTVDSFNSGRGFWKRMKLNITIQTLSSVLILSLYIMYVDILELRDQGYWWAPIASGAIMGLSLYCLFTSSNNYYRAKYSDNG